MRMITRQKNVVRYHVRKYIQDIYEARSDFGAAKDGSTEYLQALKRHEIAARGLKKNFDRLKKLCPNDPLISTAAYWLNEKA